MVETENADVRIIKTQFKIGQFLAHTPVKTTPVDKCGRVKTVYLHVLFLVIFIIFIGTLYHRYGNYVHISFLEVTLDVSNLLSKFILVFGCFYGNWRKYDKSWNKFFESLDLIEAGLKEEHFLIRTRLKLFWLEIAAYHTILVILLVTEMNVLLVTTENKYDIIFNLSVKIALYYQFFELIFISNLTKLIRRRYNFLSKMILSISRDESRLFYTAQNGSIDRKLKRVFSLYQTLYILVVQVNVIHGWQILFILISTVLTLLNCTNTVLVIGDLFRNNTSIMDIYVVYLILYPIIYIVSTIALIMSCDSVERSGEKVINTCYRRTSSLEHCQLRNDLIRVAKYMEHLKPTLSAAGFFQINQRILATMFTSVITYILIIIQFN